MRKQYIFFVLIVVMLYLMYLIVSYKYKEYLINSNIEYLNIENTKISSHIDNYKRTLDYLNTESYKNKVLKEEQGMKNKGEKVVYITSESQYTKFIKTTEKQVADTDEEATQTNIYDNMTNFEKWIYFIFKKDIRE
ncbi:MAG: hypothetical protein PHG82_01030 [Candidatus Gracilibacteria bacterium]|nr:hypothetical protein [Candidatus Gracilibacteria bacterium]